MSYRFHYKLHDMDKYQMDTHWSLLFVLRNKLSLNLVSTRIQNALTAALETNKQAQQQTQEKKQQIIDLQHETREVLYCVRVFGIRILGLKIAASLSSSNLYTNYRFNYLNRRIV